MARQTVNVGSGSNSGDGEGLRTAFLKVENNFGDLYTHANSTSNPHNVTAAQVGAISTTLLDAAGGVAGLDGSGKLKTAQRPTYALDAITIGDLQYSLTPSSTTSFDLGSSSKRWSTIYVNTIIGTTFSANSSVVTIESAPINSNSSTTALDIIQFSGRSAIRRLNANGAMSVGAANTTIIASGNAAAIVAGNVTLQHEHLYLVGGNSTILYSNVAGGWSSRKTMTLGTDGSLTLESMLLKGWTASNTDIDGLVPGISTGSIVEGPLNGHLVLGVQSNDNGDGLFVMDKGDGNSTYTNLLLGVSRSQLTYLGNNIAHSGNLSSLLLGLDGASSGFDADLLDGQHGSYYQNATNLNAGTVSDSRLPSSMANKTITGTFTHNGLTPTTGTAIDQIYSVTDSLTLSTSWQDTSVNAAELATGSYMVQVTISDTGVGGTINNEVHTGVMSWYGSDTNETTADEILLHRAGIANGGNTIFLQIVRTLTASASDLKLQISSTNTDSGASNVVMKFRRMI